MREKIAERIKEIRIENKMSQSCFGQKLNVSQDTVSLWENGKLLPMIDKVVMICQLFGVSSDYLLGLED